MDKLAQCVDDKFARTSHVNSLFERDEIVVEVEATSFRLNSIVHVRKLLKY